MSHGKHKVKCMKQFFVKSFWVSILLVILMGILASLTFDFGSSMAERFYGLDPEDYAKILCYVMGIWKILIIQFTLVPAIVTCMIAKHIEKNEEDGGCDEHGCGCH